MDGNGTSWVDAAWTIHVDRAILIACALVAGVALLGLIEALFAPAMLRRQPFRFGVSRAARSRRHAVLEFSLWLAWSAGMLLSSGPGHLALWAKPLPMLALLPIALLWLRRRSHAGAGRR